MYFERKLHAIQFRWPVGYMQHSPIIDNYPVGSHNPDFLLIHYELLFDQWFQSTSHGQQISQLGCYLKFSIFLLSSASQRHISKSFPPNDSVYGLLFFNFLHLSCSVSVWLAFSLSAARSDTPKCPYLLLYRVQDGRL